MIEKWKKGRDLQLFNTPYFTGGNAEKVIEKFELASNELMQWFLSNEMKANPNFNPNFMS